MNEPAPRVSIVVPTYQRCASMRRLLKALLAQTLPPEGFEVIVSIDGSEDGTLEMVQGFQTPFHVHCLWQPNRGRAAACNAGIRAARGEFVVLLDDDMEPAPEFLVAHLRAHEKDDRLGILGAVPIPVNAATPPVVRFVADKFNRHLERLANKGEIRFRSFYSGNFSIRRAVLVEAGMFDERYRVYGNEDTELSMRLTEIGVQIRYDPDPLAIQHYEKDFAGLARDNFGKGRTAVVTARKHLERFGSFDERSFRRNSDRWTDRSVKWKVVRSALLLAGRYSETPSRAVVRVIEWLEGHQPKRMTIPYLFALDFFYWRGVAVEAKQGETGADFKRGGAAEDARRASGVTAGPSAPRAVAVGINADGGAAVGGGPETAFPNGFRAQQSAGAHRPPAVAGIPPTDAAVPPEDPFFDRRS